MTASEIVPKAANDMQADADSTPLSEEELDRLANDPRIKELRHKLAYSAGDKFKLELTGGRPQEVRRVEVAEGSSAAEQQAALHEAMRQQALNDERDADEKRRRLRNQRVERMKRSDPWCYMVKGAGNTAVNGTYSRHGDAVRNGARVYQNGDGFLLSRESIGGLEGWVVGKVPRAFYAYQTSDTLAPESGWSVQEHGVLPAPSVVAVEPHEAVQAAKQAGNTFFKESSFAHAITCYNEALDTAAACAGADGVTDELLARLHGNRAEAHLNLEQWEEALHDAETAMELDPCFVKAYVRRAKAKYSMQQYEDASRALADALQVLPGNKEVMALAEEYRVASLARSAEEPTLAELSALCDRLSQLLQRKGAASEVTAILTQMPTLLQALKIKPDAEAVGGKSYESCPNHDAQVFLRLRTNSFALLAPLIRPNAKQIQLLIAVLETAAAALRDCPTNQVVFDKFVPQLVPLLRHKDAFPLEVLKAATKVLGSMAHRASARRVMHDPDTADGLMHVLSFPDSSAHRLHISIISALDDMKDTTTIANLLAVPGACDTFWREAHSRNAQVQWPSRSLVAHAMANAACRKRLRLVDRSKRVVDLFEKILQDAKVLEEYILGSNDEDDETEQTRFAVRDVAALPTVATDVLTGFAEGLSAECAADMALVEALSRHGAWVHVAQMCLARPPLSAAAIRLMRTCMQQSQKVVDTVQEVNLPLSLLQCREVSEHTDDINANVKTTMLSQQARNDALQILGFASNDQMFHECANLFAAEDVLHALLQLISGRPSDDAACAACRCLNYLLTWRQGARRKALSPQDVHDVLVPLYLGKQELAKDAAAKTLRIVFSDVAWVERATSYFEERGASAKLYQVIQELNSLEQLKQLHTTGQSADALSFTGEGLEAQLESERRVASLQPQKVVEHFRGHLSEKAIIVDVGAGTGIFSFAFAAALPGGTVFALEVRSDAIRAIKTRSKREQITNVITMRMDLSGVPALPEGALADLVFVCDVLEFVPEAARESFALKLRSLLAPDGSLVVICDRSRAEAFIIDIQDAGFVQRRCAQIVSGRRLMLFSADVAAAPPPTLSQPPAEVPEDNEEYILPSQSLASPQSHEVDLSPSKDVEDEDETSHAGADVDVDDDGEGCRIEELDASEECLLEENGATDPQVEADAAPLRAGPLVDGEKDVAGSSSAETATAAAAAEEEEEEVEVVEESDGEDCLLEVNGDAAAGAQEARGEVEIESEGECALEENDGQGADGASALVPSRVDDSARAAEEEDGESDGECLLEEN